MPLHRFLIPFAFASLCLPIGAAQTPAPTTDDYSGMYSFLKDGEFIQITIEEKGKVSGFISRFGDSESDKGTFLDQFFKVGRFEGNKLTFTTEIVHGLWFDFDGSFARGPGKTLDEEAYYILKGTLTRNTTGEDKKTSSRSTQVEFKSFPREAGSAQ